MHIYIVSSVSEEQLPSVCVSAALQGVSECSRKQRKRQPVSFMLPQGVDVASFHVRKSPPERDDKVALTWQFPAVHVNFIK